MTTAAETEILRVEGLTVSFGGSAAVKDVSYTLHEGETLAIVGASGSGKSVSSLALMGLLHPSAHVDSGSALYNPSSGDRIDLLNLSKDDHRKVRGKEIAMIFQEPMTALNPVYRCGEQVAEALRIHTPLSRSEIKDQVIRLFDEVQLPEPEKSYHKYPHEMSGGQKQRVMIAMAMSCKPRILIADEPTTALDVTVQAEILELLKSLQKDYGMGLLFITHDLSVVEDIADNIVVMHKGQVVESGNVSMVLNNPREAYTKGLINSRPPLNAHPKRLHTVEEFLTGSAEAHTQEILSKEERRCQVETLMLQKPLLRVRSLNKTFAESGGLFNKKDGGFKALQDIDLDIYPGETLGLVGGSGSGKTTLGRSLLQLIRPETGSIQYQGQELVGMSEKQLRSMRRELQIIFQDPYSSLNPKITIGAAIMEVMQVHDLHSDDTSRKREILRLLDSVGLESSHYARYPHEFSGGQRQRVVIARTLAVKPKLIICDESVSALDVSVQAQVLNLLNDLKEEHGLTYVFISHDMAVVKYMSDRMIVLDKGRIVETDIAEDVFSDPQSIAAQKLVTAIPGSATLNRDD